MDILSGYKRHKCINIKTSISRFLFNLSICRLVCKRHKCIQYIQKIRFCNFLVYYIFLLLTLSICQLRIFVYFIISFFFSNRFATNDCFQCHPSLSKSHVEKLFISGSGLEQLKYSVCFLIWE